MSEKNSSPAGVGIVTVITLLSSLCLAVFATLTFATAKADWRLSSINADTVTAYYNADSTAARLYADFASSTDASFKQSIAISDTQSLYIEFSRSASGAVVVDSWKTVPIQPETDNSINVWDGE